ncbi:MAG: TIGR02466 family protein [Planctomycetota bacterium]
MADPQPPASNPPAAQPGVVPAQPDSPVGAMKVQAQMTYCTPILVGAIEGTESFNAELRDKVLEMRQAVATEQKADLPAWRSNPDLLQKVGEPYSGTLARLFLNLVAAGMQALQAPVPKQDQHRVDAWATVLDKGASVPAHVHPGSPWTGLYFVATEAGKAGEARFTDPRAGALTISHPFSPWPMMQQVRMDAKPGTMLVFPSFLTHAVDSYQGDAPRITVSLNLR